MTHGISMPFKKGQYCRHDLKLSFSIHSFIFWQLDRVLKRNVSNTSLSSMKTEVFIFSQVLHLRVCPLMMGVVSGGSFMLELTESQLLSQKKN